MFDQEKKEIHYLMRFFSQPQIEQWKQVPDEFPEVIFDNSPFYAKVTQPIEFLSLVLASLTQYLSSKFDDPELVEVLFEAYVLLNDFMLESMRDSIFVKKATPEQTDYVWKTFARICHEVLQFEELTGFETAGINFDKFVEKYAVIE